MINGYTNGYINTTSGFNYGWICPKCNRVYNPMVQECCQCNFDKVKPYTGPTVTFTTASSEVNNNEQDGKK